MSQETGRTSAVKQALFELREMRARVDELEKLRSEPIAIVGVGARVPGSPDVESFWRLLHDRRNAITDVPAERWDAAAYYDADPDVPGKMSTRRGGFLPDVDRFDAHFFGVSPREAVSMDPQQRMLLETSWRALEHAGIAAADLAGGLTGIFVGLSNIDYYRMVYADRSSIDAYSTSGTSGSVAAGRLSYVLGLRGPSLVVDTACSSSLVAVHLACQSLRLQECGLALAGGVNLILSPEVNIACSKARMMAADGLCKTFDTRADGYVRSEGCGVVVLKRLSDAQRDGDRILAIIRGSAVTQDGRSSGLTVPNGPSQEAAIRRALALAGVNPGDVDYVEAHGTGTSLGDPIEIRALGNVFAGRPSDRPLTVGAVKANIGHLEAAAGIAGLIKVVLALQHEEIPGQPQLGALNTHVDWAALPVAIASETIPWVRGTRRRLAGVSSFGFSGTNAHLVMEEPPPVAVAELPCDRTRVLLAISARNPEALADLASAFGEHLSSTTDPFADLCAAANSGRSHFAHRMAVVAANASEMSAALADAVANRDNQRVARGVVDGAEPPDVVFLFTGQGAQYSGMGRVLYDTHPLVRKILDRCDDLLIGNLGRSLRSVMFDESEAANLAQTAYAQPALFALQFALAELWKSWGVRPAAVMGHSVGELAAACAAGVFGLEDGLRLVAARGRLMQSLADEGEMLLVSADEARVRRAIAGREQLVAIAALNGPDQVVISGARDAVRGIAASLAETGVKSKEIGTTRAFHSPLMDPMLDEFEHAASAFTFSAPRVPLISNLTGDVARADALNAGYWRRQIREPVRFAQSIDALRTRGHRWFIEIGPHPTLLGMARRFADAEDVRWLPSLRRNRDDWDELLGSLGSLYVAGVPVDWHAFERPYGRRRVVVPGYQFQRQRYWIENNGLAHAALSSAPAADAHPLLGRRVETPLASVLFEKQIGAGTIPFLVDHRVFGTLVFPMTGYLEMAAAAASQVPGGATVVEDVVIAEPLLIGDEGSRRVQTVLTPNGTGETAFQVFSRTDDEEQWHLHASATLRAADTVQEDVTGLLSGAEARCGERVLPSDHYDVFSRNGLEYGPSFRGIVELSRTGGEAVGNVRLPGQIPVDGYLIHPGLLDSCFHLIVAALPGGGEAFGGGDFYLPVSVQRIRILQPAGAALRAYARLHPMEGDRPDTIAGDVRVFSETGELVASIDGLMAKRATAEKLRSALRTVHTDWLYQVDWQPKANLTPVAPEARFAGTWILVGGGGLSAAVRERLEAAGGSVVQASLDHGRRADLERLVAQATTNGAVPLAGVVHLSNAEAAVGGEPAGTMTDDVRRSCEGLLHIVRPLVASGAPLRLCVVTRGATQDGAAALSQAAVLALVRTIGAESPQVKCVSVDLDSESRDLDSSDTVDNGDSGDAGRVWQEVVAPDGEDQVSYRAGARCVARLVRYAAASEAAATPPSVQLTIATRGILDQLRLEPLARRAPGPGEVEVEVVAAGLNFRDVLNALGMYPGDPGALGNECTGVVTAIGSGVTSLAVGQAVLGNVLGGFRSFAVMPADWVVPKPAALDFEDAATIPMAFLTAEYALNRLAGLKRGERVLIHAAAGGVGMAAIQIARRAGAEIFATCGSPEKRKAIEALGVTHVMNSRSLDFAGAIMAETGGEGVDVVLNSLSGDFIPESLGVLRRGGRFLEIGKRGIWTAEEMSASRPDVAYFPIFLGEVDGALIQTMLRDLVAAFVAGELRPLPKKVFTLEDSANAFRHMAQARHIGKVVLSVRRVAVDAAAPSVRPNATYLITGGSGGLGLQVAGLLAARGATHLVLASRREPSDAARTAIAAIERAGANVIVASADIGREGDVIKLIADIDRDLPPLAGVVHAAGLVEDGLLGQQEWEQFERVLAPKVDGAWHLHRQTRSHNLAFFVLFSSTAAILPSAGQGNYAAANASLDALAHYRRRLGVPGLSINWGPWADVGMAAGLGARDQRRWTRLGVQFMAPAAGLAIFERLLDPRDGRGAQVAVLTADWRTFAREAGDGRVIPLLSALVAIPAASATARTPEPAAQRPVLLEEIERAPEGRRREIVVSHVREQVRQVLALEPAFVLTAHQGLTDIGMDSLMALELRNRLQRSLGQSLPATLTFDRPTVAALAEYLATLAGIGSTPPSIEEVPHLAVAQARPELDDAVAVIGIGCRFPGGASDPERYWRLLRDGVDAITEIPRARWNIDEYYDANPDAPGKMSTRSGGFLEQVDRFDAPFFGISPREAISLDPQQRLLLEVSWEALEHAGQSPERLLGSRSGVFVGIGTYDYAMLQMKQADPSRVDAYFGTGTSLSAAAGRIAYSLGLQGPCMAVDTACSSSLVAIHLACRSLRSDECRLALAGGVNVMLTPEPFVNGSRARMLAADGRCKTFDADADGYARAEGAGVLVLKRLRDAVADGDSVLAVIRGTAVNQDGRSSGLTVPNGPAQQAVIREALADAGVAPGEVGYVEAHGTGTALGDPIEVQAIRAVLAEQRPAGQPLVMGSVKTNIGHLEAAAGVAALTKVILSLQGGEIPPHLHFRTLNPHIELGDGLVIPLERRPWTRSATRRIAGVSSFGFSGTNAHVIVEEPPLAADSSIGADRPLHIMTASAKSEAALGALAGQRAAYLARVPDLSLADAAFTANAGRAHFGNRLAIVAATREEASEALAAAAAGRPHAAIRSRGAAGDAAPQVVFLFTGQGSQHVGMGRELYDTQPVFRAALDRCDGVLSPLLGMPVSAVLYPSDSDGSRLDATMYTQPALFALEWALAELWQSWGIRPSAVLGHSAGEYVAACVAGVMTVEEGLRLVAARGRLMQALPGGSMAAVFASEAVVAGAVGAVEGRLALAAVNGPEHVVISGAPAAIDRAIQQFGDRGIRTQRLVVSHAFHSADMDPMLDEYEQIASGITFNEPRLPLVSNVTGRLAEPGFATPGYWRRHVREAVRFADGIAAVRALGCTHWVEVGPRPTLIAMARRFVGEEQGAWLPSLRPARSDWDQMLDSLAVLYVAGAPVDWRAFDRPYARHTVSLPTYPFERRRFWLDGSGLAPETEESASSVAADSEPAAPGDWIYRTTWTAAPEGADRPRHQPGTWLVLSDRAGLGEQLIDRLEARGDACARIFCGESAGSPGHRTWYADPSAEGAMAQIVAEVLATVGGPLAGIVHLWSLDVPEPGRLSTADLDPAHALGAGSLLRLIQALVHSRVAAPVYMVTNGTQPIASIRFGAPAPAIMQTTVWGLGRGLAVEHPELWGGLFDVDLEGAADHEDTALQLLAAIDRAADGEDQVALRGGERRVPRLVRDAGAAAAFSGCRPDATYLVTGGLGVLGLKTAQWLARRGARQLVLVGRRGLPDRESWPALDPASDAWRTVAAIQTIEATGATVQVVAGDVADENEMSILLDRIRQTLPPLRGIVHAAGVYGGCRLKDMSFEALASMLRPKVTGGVVLDRLTRGDALDFFVLFSSISSLIGTIDLGHYAAANSFLDGLAEYRRAAGLPAVSINWGAWEHLQGSAEHRRTFERSGMRSMASDRAFAALGQALASDATQIAVASVDWATFRPVYEAKRRRPFLDALGVAPDVTASAALQRPVLADALRETAPDQRREVITTHVRACAAAVIGLAPREIEPRKGFFDLGMDSLMSVELRRRLEAGTGLSLPATLTFKYATVAALAAFLDAELAAADGPSGNDGAGNAEAWAPDEEDLSETELAALLAEKLAQIR